jgi:holo-[acyl-carrier protein] synthase
VAPSDLPRIRVGVDLVGVDRVTRLLEEHPASEATLFTAREREYCRARRRCYEHMAARFAAKEAVLKSFGTGMTARMRWTEVEIVPARTGRPQVKLSGGVADWARRLGIVDVDVSLSHTEGLAIAQAVAIWDRRGEPCAST